MPHADNNADNLGAKLPTRPRFTLDSLREIRIATGDGESTIANYTYTINGASYTKYAAYDDLTKSEREAALTFMLKFSGATVIRRKGKPRGRAVAGRNQRRRRQPAPGALELTDFEFEPLQMDFEPCDLEFEPLELTDRDFEVPGLTDQPEAEAEKVLPKPKKRRPRRKQ